MDRLHDRPARRRLAKFATAVRTIGLQHVWRTRLRIERAAPSPAADRERRSCGKTEGDRSNDAIVTFRVGGLLPVIFEFSEDPSRSQYALGLSGSDDWRRLGSFTDARKPSNRSSRFARPSCGAAWHRCLSTFQGEKDIKLSARRKHGRTVDPHGSPRLRLCLAAVRYPGSAHPDAGVRHGDGARERADAANGQGAGEDPRCPRLTTPGRLGSAKKTRRLERPGRPQDNGG